MDTCRICAAPAEAAAYACARCTYQVRAWLRELPRQLPLLHACLQLDGGPAHRGGIGRAHAPLPLRLDTLNLLGPGHTVALEDPHGDQTGGIPITAVLAGWARYIAADHPAVTRDQHGTAHIDRCTSAVPRHGAGIPGWCAWLIAYLPYAVTRPWIADLYEQLDALIRTVRGITRTQPRRHTKTAPCPGCGSFALVAVDGEWYVACEACPQLLTPDEYAAHSARVLPALTALAVRIAAHQTTKDVA